MARMGERGNTYRIVVRDLPGRPRHVFDDNIKMDIK